MRAALYARGSTERQERRQIIDSQLTTRRGWACKTLFVPRYLHEEPMRLAVQRQLNRGEARHALARWLFFANRGEFRAGDYEEVMNKASCLGLLSNAAALWNTVQIERVVGRLRAGGDRLLSAVLSKAFLLARDHRIADPTILRQIGPAPDRRLGAGRAMLQIRAFR